MTAPPIVGLSDEQALMEAQRFFAEVIVNDALWTPDGQRKILGALLQRVYQEGVVAGMDRAIATVKTGHR